MLKLRKSFCKVAFTIILALLIPMLSLSPQILYTARAEANTLPGDEQNQITNVAKNVCFNLQNKTIEVGGNKIILESAPVIVEGRTLVPVRSIIENLGGTMDWFPGENKIHLEINSKKVDLWINKKEASVDEQTKSMDVAPTIINGRTLVPVRFVCENSNFNVFFRHENNYNDNKVYDKIYIESLKSNEFFLDDFLKKNLPEIPELLNRTEEIEVNVDKEHSTTASNPYYNFYISKLVYQNPDGKFIDLLDGRYKIIMGSDVNNAISAISSNFANLKKIKLEGIGYNNIGLKMQLLGSLKNIKDLTLTNFYFSNESNFDVLSQLTNLKKLRIKDSAHVPNIIQNPVVQKLETLSIVGTSFASNEPFKSLATANFQNLEELELSALTSADSLKGDWQNIGCNFLKNSVNITKLVLAGNPKNNLNSTSQLSNLEYLDLSQTNFDYYSENKDQISSLEEVIYGLPNLRTLYLNNTNLINQGNRIRKSVKNGFTKG